MSANLTRETISYSAEFLNGDAAQFAEVLGDVVSNQKFQPHEFVDVAKQTAAESSAAAHSAEVAVLEAAHRAAFRTGLGNAIFANPNSRINNDAVKAYAAELFQSGNIALVGSGLPLEAVKEFAETFINVPSGNVSREASKYYGGEVRIESSVDGKSHYILAFEGAPLNSSEYAAAQVLRFALGGEQRVQNAAAAGILGEAAAKLGQGAQLKAFNIGYSDAGLFGVYASAPSSSVGSAVAAAAEQLKLSPRVSLNKTLPLLLLKPNLLLPMPLKLAWIAWKPLVNRLSLLASIPLSLKSLLLWIMSPLLMSPRLLKSC